MRKRGDPGSLDLRGVWFLVHEGGIPGSPEMTLRGGLFFDMRGGSWFLGHAGDGSWFPGHEAGGPGFQDMRSGLLVPLTWDNSSK